MAVIEQGRCAYCGGCVSMCPSGALELAETRLLLDQELCNECGLCVAGCPTGALAIEPAPLASITTRR